MPFIGEIPTRSKTRLFLWKVEEDPADSEYAELVKSFKGKSTKRLKEELGGALLMDTLGIRNQVRYLDNGKPVIEGFHISISHTEDIVGIVISDEPVGIDIQDPTPKLFNIKEKFCHDSELALWQDDLDKLTFIWCAKEVVFKIYGEDLAFAEEMRVEFDEADPTTYKCTSLKHSKEFVLDWLHFEGKKVVWSRT